MATGTIEVKVMDLPKFKLLMREVEEKIETVRDDNHLLLLFIRAALRARRSRRFDNPRSGRRWKTQQTVCNAILEAALEGDQ